MKWFALLLSSGLLILAALVIYEWYVARINEPTRFAEMRALVERPVFIDGEERQPRLRRVK